jgi:hypothetical protein
MTDLLHNIEYQLQVSGGDFVTGRSDEQHQGLLIVSAKGDFKEFPSACVGAYYYLKDEQEQALLSAIKWEFEKDGITVNRVYKQDGQIITDAFYKTT